MDRRLGGGPLRVSADVTGTWSPLDAALVSAEDRTADNSGSGSDAPNDRRTHLATTGKCELTDAAVKELTMSCSVKCNGVPWLRKHNKSCSAVPAVGDPLTMIDHVVRMCVTMGWWTGQLKSPANTTGKAPCFGADAKIALMQFSGSLARSVTES